METRGHQEDTEKKEEEEEKEEKLERERLHVGRCERRRIQVRKAKAKPERREERGSTYCAHQPSAHVDSGLHIDDIVGEMQGRLKTRYQKRSKTHRAHYLSARFSPEYRETSALPSLLDLY